MEIKRTSKLLVIILTIIAVTLTASTAAVLNVNQSVSTAGTVTTTPNIGVYSDSACTINITSINWGPIAAGGSANQTVYVKNTGTGTMTLSLGTNNWSPAGASSYMTVTWNQGGTQLTAGQSVAATITLSVSSSINSVTSFTNIIMISGTG